METPFSIFSPSLFPSPERPSTTVLANNLDRLSASLICVISLLIPPGVLRQSLVFPTLLYLFYHGRQAAIAGAPNDSYMDYIHLTWTLIRWTDLTLLRTAETSVHRTQEPGGTPVETAEDIQKYPIHRKFWWSASLLSQLRGVGWSFRVRNIVPVDASTTRLSACLSHLLLLVKYTMILDLRDYMTANTALLTPQTFHSYFSLPLLHQLIYVWVGVFNTAAQIGLTYHLPALLAVALHLSPPQTWPPILGPWSSAYTVRNAWGRLWHQNLRRFFEVSNDTLLKLLRIKRGTLLSKYFQVYVAFFLSALFHHAGALNVPYCESVRYQFLFFLLQPVCITIEDIAVAFGKKAGIQDSSFTRVLGYLWTFAAISFTTRYIAVYLIEMGTFLIPNPILFRFWDRFMPLLGLPRWMHRVQSRNL